MKLTKKQFLLAISLLLLTNSLFAQEQIDLSGTWAFAIDKNDQGIQERWFDRQLEDQITLPGSMPENLKGDLVTVHTQWVGSLYDSTYYYSPRMEKYRHPENIKFPFFLTPERHYVGAAWYQKIVDIPEGWVGKHIRLFMERPHIETTVWVDGKQVGESQYSLSVPHVYDLTSLLKPGKHRLTIRVDNTIQDKFNPGIDSHSITDQTQGNWNGIVGKINVSAHTPVYFEDIQVYPDVKNKKAVVKISLKSDLHKAAKGKLTLAAESFNSDKKHVVKRKIVSYNLKEGEQLLEIPMEMGKNMLTWDEFDPALYKLKVKLTHNKVSETKEVQFGMREIKIDGKWFYVNGRKTMLRGTVENCCFPLTGYAPMDVDSWMHVFRVCREHGLNHMRFHSVCPPEAAFIAADLTGFYLQPEGPSWPNHGVRLGVGMGIDSYLMEETQALTKAYGNYASYTMLSCGNEPAGNWVAWVTDFVKYWEKTDSRRVYTGASVGGSWAWQPANQYHVKAGARGLNWNGTPESMLDYRDKIDTVKQPFVSHETGQWCVFPNLKETEKYTGVNKAKNFEIFRDFLEAGDMLDLADDFLMSSGKFQALCYKHEIEKTMRTPDYAGFQLLSLNDYSGQGSAIVGLLDVFWDEKPYINAEQFRRFCNTTVPLTRFERFVFKNSETLKVKVEIAHFGEAPLEKAQINWRIKDTTGAVHDHGSFAPVTIPLGNCNEIGEINLSLADVHHATQFNLEVKIDGTEFINDWDFWVYPESLSIDQGAVYITDTLNQEAIRILENGGDVLILAAGKISYGRDIVQQLTPVFWNTSWFKMRPPHTTGLLVDPAHGAFADFPTQFHSNVQWAELTNKTQVMQFTDFPQGFQPLVQSIHTWFISRKIGSLFEANVLNGRLMMTTMDLQNDLEHRFVARQMLSSILDHMNSSSFHPKYRVELQQIADLFTKDSEQINMFTVDAPDELKAGVK